MKISDNGISTIVDLGQVLSEEEKKVLSNYLLLFKSHIQEKERSDEIEKFAGELKKGRWQRFLKSREHGPINTIH